MNKEELSEKLWDALGISDTDDIDFVNEDDATPLNDYCEEQLIIHLSGIGDQDEESLFEFEED